MNSKEININIEVKIAGEIVSLAVPFSRQDFVRKTESEIRFYLKELREKYPGKGQKDLLAMMTYHYASAYFSLVEQRRADIEEAEELLAEAERLCGSSGDEPQAQEADEFDVY